MTTNFDVMVSPFARHNRPSLASLWVLYPTKLLWEKVGEATVDCSDTCSGHLIATKSALVDPALDFDMSFGFQLQIPPFLVVAEIIIQCALNIDRQRIATLDQVAVIAIHRSDKIGQRVCQARWEAGSK